ERARAERALRDSEERVRLAADAAQMGTWVRDLKSDRLDWSPMQERLMGFAPGTFPGNYEAFHALVVAEHRELLAQAQARAISSGLYEAELHFRLADGRERWGLVRG